MIMQLSPGRRFNLVYKKNTSPSKELIRQRLCALVSWACSLLHPSADNGNYRLTLDRYGLDDVNFKINPQLTMFLVT